MVDAALSSCITYNPLTVNVDTSLDELVRMLDDFGFHHWPVVDDDRHLVGMVSDVDILRALEKHNLAVWASGVVSAVNLPVAGEIMSRKLIAVEHHETLRGAIRRMVAHRIHSLPVLEDKRLLGVITSTDFVREFSFGTVDISRESVSDFMITSTESIDAAASLDDALRAMSENGDDFVAVVRDESPIGVLTRREARSAKCRLATCSSRGQKSVTVGDLLLNVPTLRPGQRLFEAAALMIERKTQAIAVVNQALRLMGVITESDLLRAILERT